MHRAGHVAAIAVLAALGALLPLPALAEVPTSVITQVPLAGDSVLTGLEPFRLLALSWDRTVAADPPEVEVHDGTGWHDLPVEVESSDVRPDDGSREAARATEQVFTEPVWVDAADGVRLSRSAALTGLTLHLARDETVRVVRADLTGAGATVPPDGPAVSLRGAWGAAPPTQTNSVARSLALAVVHHTAGGNDYAPADVPAILRSIQAFHQGSRGWNDIAYNFLVDRFGGIWEGRAGGVGAPVVGAHAAGVNTGSVGVSVLGDFSTGATAPTAAVDAVADVIGWKLALHGIDPLGSAPVTMGSDNRYPEGTVVTLPRVVGHQQVGTTSCPGSLMDQLGRIRSRAAERAPYARGHLDGADLADRTVTVAGWASDRRTTDPISVAVTVGTTRAVTVTADAARPDVAAAIPGTGPAHGFRTEVTVGEGDTPVCAWALDATYGAATSLGCRTISIPRTPRPAPPNVTVAVPTATSGFIRGRVDAVLTSTSPFGISGLDLMVDGTSASMASPGPDGTARVTLETSNRPDGPTVLQGRAVDGTGQQATSSPLRLVVDNTRPGVLVLAPSSSRGGTQLEVGVGATDGGGVHVTFLALGDRVVGGFLGAGARSFRVALPRTGRHRLVAATVDLAGNLSFSNQVWVTARRR